MGVWQKEYETETWFQKRLQMYSKSEMCKVQKYSGVAVVRCILFVTLHEVQGTL